MGAVRLIELDARSWQTIEGVFEALLAALGSPEWHGHNLNALHDSLYGGMNEVEPPFTVIVNGTTEANAAVASFLVDVEDVFNAARRDFGHDVHFYRQ